MGKKKKNKQPKAAERVGVGDGESVPLDQSQNQDVTGQVDRTFVSEAVDVRFYAQNADLDLSGDRPDGSPRATLEETIKQLQRVNFLHNQKEADLLERINQIVEEKNAWALIKENLLERIKQFEGDRHSWILKENSFKETIVNLNDDIANLTVQVTKLEESRNSLLQENKQLMENISSLQLEIMDLNRMSLSLSSDELPKVDAACVLVEKLVAENAELVEKVNDLHVELKRSAAAPNSSSLASDLITGTGENEMSSVADSVTITNENIPLSSQKLDLVQVVPLKEDRNSVNSVDSYHDHTIEASSTDDESVEIVQIPLHENEVQDLELQVEDGDGNYDVPLTDAPLIGAPFRFMSFVARYVSGSDLVDKKSLGSS